jgi:peptidoglycan/LPS O-acetylase OafA/YrhL
MSGQKSGGFYIPSLDGLRCFAVMTVFVAHVFEQYNASHPGAHIKNVVPGSFGVTIFFFLSGYLITTLMRMEHQKTGRVALKLFYLRRVVRILPPFYLVLAVGTIATLVGFLPNRIEPTAVLAQALHFTNYYIVSHGWWEGMAPGTWIFWSLAIEEHFYLVFPWLFLLLQRLRERKHQAWVLLGLCLLVVAWRLVLVLAFDAPKDRTYVATDTRFDSMLFGCALALWGNPVLDATTLSERVWKWVLWPLAVVGLLVSFVVRHPVFNETVRYSLQGVCLFPIYVVAVRYPTWGLMRVLNTRLMKWVGLLSYSLYLVHPMVLEVIDVLAGKPSFPVLFVSGLVGSFAASAAIYYGVEKPMGGLRKKLAA